MKRYLELEKLFGVDFLPVSRSAPAAAAKASAPSSGLPPEIEALRAEVAGCTKCRELCSTRTQTVFGVGSLKAPLMFIGEAPGQDEDLKGEPFVGRAGQLLTKTLAKLGVRREQVYIANILKCRPPGNRQPLPAEMAACMPFLLRQIAFLRPKILCLLGNVALQGLLPGSRGITSVRGRYVTFQGIQTLPAFHPAYVLRNMGVLPQFETDLRTAGVDAGLLPA